MTAAKWDTVAGIYVRQPGGADAVYANEADKTFLWCSRGRWCISRSPEPSAEAASEALAAASALSTCASPEDADWSASGLLVLGVEHLAVGKNDREAPPPPTRPLCRMPTRGSLRTCRAWASTHR